jgi:hypothetical protein
MVQIARFATGVIIHTPTSPPPADRHPMSPQVFAHCAVCTAIPRALDNPDCYPVQPPKMIPPARKAPHCKLTGMTRPYSTKDKKLRATTRVKLRVEKGTWVVGFPLPGPEGGLATLTLKLPTLDRARSLLTKTPGPASARGCRM